MASKNIYMVQVGFAFDKSLYLPYAVGCLAAYSQADAFLKSEYRFKELIYKRDRLDDVVFRLDKPYLVAFSNYIWNFEYNKALAAKIKAAYPDCTILFGGHNVSRSAELLNEPYVDILMFGEGEIPFARLLTALAKGENLSTVTNIAYRENGKTLVTPQENFDSLDTFPSPFLSGVFDEIIAAAPDTDFLTVLETNRGCPFSCAYCDWCVCKKVRFFPLEKVKAEIEWLSAHKIEYCFCADSNFGMFKRDEEIVDCIVAAKEKNGYPKVFRPCYAKDSDERVFAISQKLNKYGMDKGATMAYQTLNNQALENINRKNLTLEHFSSLLNMYNQNNIPTYSELILGLPGETYESFSQGICTLLEAGGHNSLSVYYCEMLPNAPMADKEYIEKHKIKTATVGFNHIHSAAHEEEVDEKSTLIIETATMSHDMWIKSNIFSVCVQCFHNLGLLRCFALYLRNEKNISYYDFYNALVSELYSSKDTLANRIFKEIADKLRDSENGQWNYKNELFGEAEWFLEEGAFLELAQRLDVFYEEITPFLKSFDIDETVFDELMKYQREILRLPAKAEIICESDFDFYNYFRRIYTGEYNPLEAKKNTVSVRFDDNITEWRDYAREIVWYGRRKGATLATNGRYRLEQTF